MSKMECDRCGSHTVTQHVVLPDAEYFLCEECATHVRSEYLKRHDANAIAFRGP